MSFAIPSPSSSEESSSYTDVVSSGFIKDIQDTKKYKNPESLEAIINSETATSKEKALAKMQMIFLATAAYEKAEKDYRSQDQQPLKKAWSAVSGTFGHMSEERRIRETRKVKLDRTERALQKFLLPPKRVNQENRAILTALENSKELKSLQDSHQEVRNSGYIHGKKEERFDELANKKLPAVWVEFSRLIEGDLEKRFTRSELARFQKISTCLMEFEKTRASYQNYKDTVAQSKPKAKVSDRAKVPKAKKLSNSSSKPKVVKEEVLVGKGFQSNKLKAKIARYTELYGNEPLAKQASLPKGIPSFHNNCFAITGIRTLFALYPEILDFDEELPVLLNEQGEEVEFVRFEDKTGAYLDREQSGPHFDTRKQHRLVLKMALRDIYEKVNSPDKKTVVTESDMLELRELFYLCGVTEGLQRQEDAIEFTDKLLSILLPIEKYEQYAMPFDELHQYSLPVNHGTNLFEDEREYFSVVEGTWYKGERCRLNASPVKNKKLKDAVVHYNRTEVVDNCNVELTTVDKETFKISRVQLTKKQALAENMPEDGPEFLTVRIMGTRDNHNREVKHPLKSVPFGFKPEIEGADLGTYQLTMALCHEGQINDAGHWKCFQRRKNNEWLALDAGVEKGSVALTDQDDHELNESLKNAQFLIFRKRQVRR